MKRHKICVIGGGYWGKNHIRTLHELNALGGIVEDNKELLNDFEQEYPHAKTYHNLYEALDNDEFDGFTVATPPDTHYDIALEIIHSRKPLLVEKPLTLNIKDAIHLNDLAKQFKINLMVGHILLFHPAIVKIKEMINNGKIGKLQYIYSNRLNLGQVRTEENVFWSFAPHDIAIFQYIIESFPIDINANGSTFLQKGIPDSSVTHLKYKNNIEGHIFLSWLHPFKEHRLVVIGSEGMITFEDSLDGKPLKLYSKKIEILNKIPEKIDGPIELIHYEFDMPLKIELNYFLNHLHDKKPLIANGEHAIEVIKILDIASKQIL